MISYRVIPTPLPWQIEAVEANQVTQRNTSKEAKKETTNIFQTNLNLENIRKEAKT